MFVAVVAAFVLVVGAASVRAIAAPRRPRPASDAPTRRSWSGSMGVLLRRLRTRPADEELAVASWCAHLAREVRAGSALAVALRSVPVPMICGDRLAVAQLSIDRGTPVAIAMRLAPTGSPALDLATSVMVSVATFGGPMAEPLDHAASVLRRRSADRAEASVHAAQARLSAMVMTALPPAFLALLLATTPDARDSVVSSVGIAAVLAGAVLNLAGWRWSRRIVASCG